MTLRFVHVSDIHFGQEIGMAIQGHEDVRRELLADCLRLRTDGTIAGPATGILLTGDAAQSGKEDQFKLAADWIDKLTEVVGCKPRAVQVIPGNHDVDVSRLDHTGRMMQTTLRSKTVAEVQKYLDGVAADASNPLISKLADYRSFAGAYGSDFDSVGRPITTRTHQLAGGRQLRIIGLCSVMVSDLDDREGSMFLGQGQYVIPRDEGCENVVMVHHPTRWFMDRIAAEGYFNARARVLLTGHEHYADLAVVTREHGFQQAHLAAGAVNPPEPGGDYTFSYNWLEFTWREESGRGVLELKVYPRKWDDRAKRFDPDWARTRGQPCKTLDIDCGPAATGHSRLSVSLPTEARPEAAACGDVEVTMPVDGPPTGRLIDEGAVEQLRYVFWRYLDRTNRQRVLATLGLLRPAPSPLPTAFERSAFELASAQSKLPELWDSTMALVPEDVRRPNPFLAQE